MRLCAQHGCSAVVASGRCPTHKRTKEQHRYNVDTRKWYYTERWKHLRAIVLSRDPVCKACVKKGYASAATEVDHIIAHRGDAERFWDSDNLQGLCKRCHSQKTQRGE